MFKINRERSERRKHEKNSVFGIKKHRSAAVRGAPPGSATVLNNFVINYFSGPTF